MSQFLSNILSRHSQSENNVQPRGLGVFETQGSWPESLHSETDVNHVVLNTDTPHSENSMIEPRSDTIISTETIQKNNSEQNNNSTREENHQRIDPHHTKTNQVGNRIIEKMNFKTEKVPSKNPDIANEEAYFGDRTKGKNILKPVQYKLDIPEPNKKFPNANTMQVDKQSVPDDFTDRIVVKPNKEMKNQFPANLNFKVQNGNGINGYSNETSSADQSQSIKIHIGRIDIKAVKQQDLNARKPRKTNKSTLSLDQFLKKRERK